MPTYQDLNSAELRDWIFFLRDSRRRGGTALARQMIHRRLTLATERQVSTIISLLKARRISGEEGGFMSGPTDTAAIRKMTRAQASAYITSLKGAY